MTQTEFDAKRAQYFDAGRRIDAQYAEPYPNDRLIASLRETQEDLGKQLTLSKMTVSELRAIIADLPGNAQIEIAIEHPHHLESYRARTVKVVKYLYSNEPDGLLITALCEEITNERRERILGTEAEIPEYLFEQLKFSFDPEPNLP